MADPVVRNDEAVGSIPTSSTKSKTRINRPSNRLPKRRPKMSELKSSAAFQKESILNENAYNIFLHVDKTRLKDPRVVVYELDGTDAEKLAALQSRVDQEAGFRRLHP